MQPPVGLSIRVFSGAGGKVSGGRASCSRRGPGGKRAEGADPASIRGAGSRECGHDRLRLRGPGLRSLLRGVRRYRHLHRRGRRQDTRSARRSAPALRARPGRSGGAQCREWPPRLRHRIRAGPPRRPTSSSWRWAPPSRRGDGHADLSYVYSAARDIAPHLRGYTVIVDKSTVPVGTARQGGAHCPRREPGCGFRRGVQSGVSPRGSRDR